MKFDTYERAVEIRSEMDYLETVDGLLCNAACKQHNLAAIDLAPFSGSSGVTNQTYLTANLLEKFRKVIREDIETLKKEFEAL